MNMMQNLAANSNQFYEGMHPINEHMPPTPSYRHSPSQQQQQLQQPDSPLRYRQNNSNQEQMTCFAMPPVNWTNQQQQQPQQEPIVGPSDHYGVHHQQFSGNGMNGQSNANNQDMSNQVNGSNIKLGKPYSSTLPPEETKVCVIVDSRTPVLIKVPVDSSRITLGDLKQALPAIDRPQNKYFFKSIDTEFGVVKEEIQEDDCQLPLFKNRVVAHIVTPGHVGDELASNVRSETGCDTSNMTYTNTSYDDGSSSMMTTDLESTSYFTETDDDSASCSYSETTCDTFVSRRRNQRYRSNERSPSNNNHNRNNLRNSPYRNNGNHSRSNNLDNISSSSTSSSSATIASSDSYSDRTAVHFVTAHLVLTNENFLGLHIYANAVNGRDEGIYVDGVAANSAVAQDGRIEPGDKLIQVNEINLEELTNEEAVKVLKDAVIKRGPLKLVVAKFGETNKNDQLTGLKAPIHPIDTAAWVAHAQAVKHHQSNSATSSPSFGSNAQDTDCIRPASTGMGRMGSGLRLNRATSDVKDIVEQLKFPQLGLELRDREWLKIPIPKAFLGSDLLTWLERNVYGWSNEREIKKFASRLLKEGYIRDPLSKKSSFSSKSYYTFENNYTLMDPQSHH